MDTERYKKAKALMEKIEQCQKAKEDLAKDCFIILERGESYRQFMSWNKGLRQAMIDYFDMEIESLNKEFEEL